MNKRDFIKTLGIASSITFLNPIAASGFKMFSDTNKKVLILGGRGFLGPTIVETFLASGYEVTLLNRGKTNPELFKYLPVIICDREKKIKKDLKQLIKNIKKPIGMLLSIHGKNLQKLFQISLKSLKGNLAIITIYLLFRFMINGIKSLLRNQNP